MNIEDVDALCGQGPGSEAADPATSEDSRIGTATLRITRERPDDPQTLDFATTANPSVPEGAVQVYQSAFAASRSHPSDCYCDFRVGAAEYVGCEPEQVIPTAGRPAALRLAIATTIEAGDTVLLPRPGFEGYEREVELQGGEPVFVPHVELLDADPEDYDLVVVNTPNDPTGTAYDPRTLSTFADRCRRADTPLIVDETFLEFADLPSLSGRDGVIVVRSLMETFGFPGLRAGFAVASGVYRDRLDVARLPWAIDVPAAALAVYCMDQESFVEEAREDVRRERERLRSGLDERFDVAPSDAPFLLLDAGSSERVEAVIEQARKHDIAVRDARTFRGLDSHVRITVRLPEENDRLVEALSGSG